MKAINIKWDSDGDMQLLNELPTEIKIPENLMNDVSDYAEKVSDYISDQTGFCHYGFDLVD